MSKFIVNKGHETERDVEARAFTESGAYTVFLDSLKHQVLAIKTELVQTIEAAED
ncbi:hypothetical protein MTX38_22110 [Rhodococcus sp. ARC_M13]|uniref:hypothetical protein n=1 Tax=Rhodococcus sp. ARC_M13 TaxID=2928855 RepID=UPI001FB3C053|nr:hypothetical protein [Rhodococcus sp. ARC_M13]MCJ0899774.1 hypothetical protein [Rhodococcus sp. ARC_M13]